MKLETVTITNFRCFGSSGTEVALESDLTTFVGNNGSGKTAVLTALAKMFGISQGQRAVRKQDFHVSPESDSVESGATLLIDCVLGFPELDDENDDDDANDAVPDLFHHMSATGDGEPLKVRMRLQATWSDDGTPEGTVDEEIKWIPSLGEFDWEECRKVQPVERGFIQLIYVPASRNAADQVAALLKGRLWRAALWSDDLAKTAEVGADDVQTQFDSEEPAKFITERLEKRWQEVHQADTDTKPSMRLIDSGLEELVKKAEFVFYPDEAKQVRRLEDLSDGQRSLFHIALTAATLEIERDALALSADASVFDQDKLRRTHLTILAIEEPENSLSPFFLSRIMKQAREMGEMETAQVIVSSHSASILARVEADEIRYCRLDTETRNSTVKRLTLPDSSTEAGKYVRLAVRAYPELYFARFVILAEGDSESIMIPLVADAMGVPLDRSFVPIVPLGGRFVAHFWRLLNDLDLPHATLLDLDLGRAHGGAKAIAAIVKELKSVGRTMANNKLVKDGTIQLDEIDEIDDEELLSSDQSHPWLTALRREGVFFSSPIDLDFGMLISFPKAYMVKRPGGKGPHTSAKAVEGKKATTLKTGGNPALYPANYDTEFTWYPYLFLSGSKPDAHLAARSEITDADLAKDAPEELRKLIKRVSTKIGL